MFLIISMRIYSHVLTEVQLTDTELISIEYMDFSRSV